MFSNIEIMYFFLIMKISCAQFIKFRQYRKFKKISENHLELMTTFWFISFWNFSYVYMHVCECVCVYFS